jgi:hypothetical protein
MHEIIPNSGEIALDAEQLELERKIAEGREHMLELARIKRPLFDALQISGSVANATVVTADGKADEAANIAEAMFHIFLSQDVNSNRIVSIADNSFQVLNILIETNQKALVGQLLGYLNSLIHKYDYDKERSYFGVIYLQLAVVAQKISDEGWRDVLYDNAKAYLDKQPDEYRWETTLKQLCFLGKFKYMRRLAPKAIAADQKWSLVSTCVQLVEQGEKKQALKLLDLLLEDSTEHSSAIDSILRSFVTAGYTQEIVAIANRITTDSDIEKNLIKILLQIGKVPSQFNERFTSFFEVHKNDSVFLNECLELMIEAGNREEAIRLAEVFNDQKVYFTTAQVVLEHGDIEQAQKIIRQHDLVENIPDRYSNELLEQSGGGLVFNRVREFESFRKQEKTCFASCM